MLENQIDWNHFHQIDIRIGTVLEARYLENAKKPAIRVVIDFGELGHKKSSAQITELYKPEDLVGRQVLAVVNFPPKQIGKFMSECLVLGLPQADGSVVLVGPDLKVVNGLRLA